MRYAIPLLVALASAAVADDLILVELSGGQTIAVRMSEGNVEVLGVFETVTVIEATPTDPPPVDPPKATRVTYVWEKDKTQTPPGVAAALTELNRRGILATEFEEDTVDGTGEIPKQYQRALQAARDKGLPAIVVEFSDGGLVVVHDPKTEEDVFDAVQEDTDAD